MMMLRRIASRSAPIAGAVVAASSPANLAAPTLRSCPYIHVGTRGFLDLRKMGRSEEAIKKSKDRLSDELSRGYFEDMSEMRKHGGKIGFANKTIIPEISAVKFPELDVSSTDSTNLQLPTIADDKTPDAYLIGLSFRSSSQKMIESWTLPFLDKFGEDGKIQIYEISFIDSWILSLRLIRKYSLKIMKRSNNPLRQSVYAFGDHYYFRKNLQIINLLTGYVFLVDRLGRIRWQGFGSPNEDELSCLFSCTSILLNHE